jgi:hypothetical protein
VAWLSPGETRHEPAVGSRSIAGNKPAAATVAAGLIVSGLIRVGMLRLTAGALLLLAANAAGAATTSAPGAIYWPPAARTEATAVLLTPDASPRYTLTLPSPTLEELASLDASASAHSGVNVQARRLKVGFARRGPTGDRLIALNAIPWQVLSDGGMGARIEVRSPGAKALRLGIDARVSAPGVAIRFVGSGGVHQVFGPYLASDIARAQRYWSPVLEGDTATLEIYLPRGIGPDALELAIPQISHLARGATSLRIEPVDEIGGAASCERDVVCVATPAISSAARAVAKIFFSKRGNTFLCTATLINDSVSSNTPYVFTASHCIDSQEAASSLQAYWFFDAIACGSLAVPPYATVAGGAVLLARSDDYDWALLRMNNPPPAGAALSGWRAEPIDDGTQVNVVHHPEGDLKKLSQAAAAGTSPLPLASGTFNVAAHYTLGITEPGSSGGGLFTLSTSGVLELRGALFAGSSSCSKMRNPDYYSRLDAALPLLAQYLTPDTSSPGRAVVVEFYHAGLDDYFLTANPVEIDGLDAGVIRGWVRTGLRFLAYSDPSLAPPGVSPVCRFYVLPQYGDSHFYSADPNECAETAARFSTQWFYETPNAFYVALPDRSTGVCPANTHPVYRFLKSANQLHHRYTAEADLRNCLYYGVNPNVSQPGYCSGAQGDWIQEGYGTPPDAPVMCAPDS